MLRTTHLLQSGAQDLSRAEHQAVQAVLPGDEADLAEYMKPVTAVNDKGVRCGPAPHPLSARAGVCCLSFGAVTDGQRAQCGPAPVRSVSAKPCGGTRCSSVCYKGACGAH